MKTKFIREKHGTKIIAHRGLSGFEKENTMPAFIAAANRTYFGIETDIHKTADGKFIIIHDDNTARVALESMIVENTEYETLRALPLTDTDGKTGRIDLRMPSLSEYIGVCKKYEKIAVLELKNRMEDEDVYKIAQEIEALGYLDGVIFISFSLDNLISLRKRYPSQLAQYLVSSFTPELIETLKRHSLDLDINYKALTEDNIKLLHENGITVNTWTVDSLPDAERLAEWGVDMITTNICE